MTLAEWSSWHEQSRLTAPLLWLLLGLAAIALVYFWRSIRGFDPGYYGEDSSARSSPQQSDEIESVDPVLAAIREIWMDEGIPRIIVDATHNGVQVPMHVQERWRHQLVIDLDPRYPLRLEVGFGGCSVDLSFGGEVTRCVFAWPSIYTVQDRSTGAAVVIESRVPQAVSKAS